MEAKTTLGVIMLVVAALLAMTTSVPDRLKWQPGSSKGEIQYAVRSFVVMFGIRAAVVIAFLVAGVVLLL